MEFQSPKLPGTDILVTSLKTVYIVLFQFVGDNLSSPGKMCHYIDGIPLFIVILDCHSSPHKSNVHRKLVSTTREREWNN